MGIQGLLPLLKSIHKPTHLRVFAGQTLGIDAYGWLHRGTVACAIELAEGKPTRKHIDFAMHRVRMLIHFGVKPYLVFDGDYLPSKEHTEKERAARRKESKRVGLEMLRMGRMSQAQLELQKAVDVTPAMARELIEELKKLDVSYVVAPYEADSQLAYLEKQGVISGVISEDSDMLVFGVKCLLTKLDQYGECVMINRADFTACRDISLAGWTDKEFRIMTMLSGCDYLPGIDRMGLKTAYRLVRKHKTVERVVRTVQFEGKMKVPKDYLDAFHKAECTFLYQWVFCPEAQCLIHLNNLPGNVDSESMPFLGKGVDPDLAAGVACGDLDPNTKKPIMLPRRFDHPAARGRTVSTPCEKNGKPIDEYFKSRRIPLAELDPNSFTPSPSQQRLLQSQETRSWSASQIPPPRIFGASLMTNAIPPATAPPASRRVASSPFPAVRASPKRQRLCSDPALAVAMNGKWASDAATSRFFANAFTQPSPSVRRKSRKDEEFNLWSDDSVAEAMAEATAFAESTQSEAPVTSRPSPRKRKKMQVFAEPDPDATTALAGEQAQQSAVSSQMEEPAVYSQDSAPLLTPDMSFESAESREHSIFSKSVQVDFEALKYQNIATMRKTPSRTKSAPRLFRNPLPKTPAAAEPTLLKNDQLDIDDSGIVLESPPGITTYKFPSDVAEPGEHISDAEWLALEKQTLCPLERITALPVQGSEDQIVPESPGEVSDESGTKPQFNLSKFVFAG